MQLAHLDQRRKMLRLSVADLARLARLDKFTVYRAFNETCSPKIVTYNAIAGALEAQERRLLAHLLTLHPHAAAGLVSPAASTPPAYTPPSPAGGVSAREVAA